jgi:nucleotide-binding universal stress UspA family protein
MIVLKKILVPVDFSASSKLALGYAVSLAERNAGKVHVLHAWEVPSYVRPDLTVWSGEIRQTLGDQIRLVAESNMEEFLRRADLAGRPDVKAEVVPGVPYSTILQLAKDDKFDLIAMGTHGRSGLSHLLLGSVAEKVVRHAHCPVLTVRSEH